MNDVLAEFEAKFRLSELILVELEHWRISLRPAQPTPGSMVLSARRPIEHLGELQPTEAAELSHAFGTIERALADAFSPDKINYLCLMMVDRLAHFHVIPRYSGPVILNDREIADAAWPGPPSLAGLELGAEMTAAIRDALVRGFARER